MNKKCVDAGREGCPCVLAESGNCMVCSRLSGGSCNDCSWQGVCIYSLFLQNGRKRVSGRRSEVFPVKEIRTYSEDFKVFVLSVPRGLCQRAARPGSFVFAKRKEDRDWFGMPVSVLKSDPERQELHLGIYNCGPKSNNLVMNQGPMEIRGIYYSALSGLSLLQKVTPRTLVYAKGVAIAPLRNLIDSGLVKPEKAYFYIDISKVSLDFIKDYFGDIPVDNMEFREFIIDGFDRKRLTSGSDNILALTSPFYSDRIEKTAGRACVRPNKGNMCCGEGICGACTHTGELGETVRTCKFIP